MSVVYIYGLIDPRNELTVENVRYVGKTKRTIVDRYKQHLRDSKKYNTPVYNWIRKLQTENISPKVIEIDECNEKDWRVFEKKHIEHHRQFGKLLNVSDGGDGIEDKSRWVTVYQYDEFGEFVKKHNLSAVTQFTKEGVFIQDYVSIRNAAEITKISEDSIGMCVRKRAKSGGGFIWEYKNK